MGTYYQEQDRGRFDYDLQTIPGIPRQTFRGPAVDLSLPYIVCVGAAQTFGRFCTHPFPSRLADGLGMQVLNLSVGAAGPRLFQTPSYLDVINGARLVVLQVLSGRSERNSLFESSAFGMNSGTRLSDGKSMLFMEFFNELARTEPPHVLLEVARETQENYVQSMLGLIDQIVPPKVLLWFADRTPDDYADELERMKRFPQLVNRQMVERIRVRCDAYVESVSKSGLPQELWPAGEPVAGTTVENGVLVNRYYPSPEMHAQAAERLIPKCRDLLSKAATSAPVRRAKATKESPTYFVIVCAERTGSNLLVGLLKSHPDTTVGGELYNLTFVRSESIPWQLGEITERPEVIALRQSDPVRFLDVLFDTARVQGHRAIGFKLLYRQGDRVPEIRDHLIGEREIRVIHIKRRNLLRRLLSEQRARATGVWWVPKNEAAPPQPTIHLDLLDCLRDFDYVETKQAEYDEYFKDHEVLEVFYEDLANDTQAVATRVAEFLGLPARGGLRIGAKKTGLDSLRDAIENYEELKASVLRMASYFDE
jgi:LPS sulfotransferase NodH